MQKLNKEYYLHAIKVEDHYVFIQELHYWSLITSSSLALKMAQNCLLLQTIPKCHQRINANGPQKAQSIVEIVHLRRWETEARAKHEHQLGGTNPGITFLELDVEGRNTLLFLYLNHQKGSAMYKGDELTQWMRWKQCTSLLLILVEGQPNTGASGSIHIAVEHIY